MTTDRGPAAATSRQAVAERLASPEQLDQILEVTHLRSWLALLGLVLLLVIAFAWSLFGSIPTKIAGEGIIIRPGGLHDVYAQDAGSVKELLVIEGETVAAGQAVATVDDPELAVQMTDLRARLDTLRRRVQQMEGRGGMFRSLSPDALAVARANDELAIDEVERSLAALGERLQTASVVSSPYAGRVLEIKVRPGQIVSRGAKLLSLEVNDGGEPLQAVVYVSVGVGKMISVGMPVQIAPSTAAREESGFLLGTVSYVSDFPATREGMMRVLGNEDLVSALSADGPPFAVYADLIADSSSPSGYKWSSARGPDMKIEGGTPCEALITVREQRPIELVLPLLRQSSGM